MKKLSLQLFALAILFCSTNAVSAETQPFARITMTVKSAVITAELQDTPTTRDFIAALPTTIAMRRWSDREYYGSLSSHLSNKGILQDSFENGDVAYYVPGNSFAVFFDNKINPDISNLIVMGKVTSDLNVFNTLGENIDIRIELAQ